MALRTGDGADQVIETGLGGVHGRLELVDLPGVLDQAQLAGGLRQRVVDLSGGLVGRQSRGLAHPVHQRSDRGVGLGDHPQPDRVGARVLGQGVPERVDVGAADPGGRLDLLDGGAHPHPQLAVARVGVELLARPGGPGAEVEHRLVGGLVRLDPLTGYGERIEDEDGVGLEVGSRTRQMGEGRMGAEAVVAVVVAGHQRSGGDDQALAGEEGPQSGTTGLGPWGGVAASRRVGGARAPARADEVAEGLVGGLTGAIVAALGQ